MTSANSTFTQFHFRDTSALQLTLIAIGVAVNATHWFVYFGTLAILLACALCALDTNTRSFTFIVVRDAIQPQKGS